VTQDSPDHLRFLQPDVVAKLANMELIARLVVEGFITGLHKSPYHGFSVEFAEHRQYMAGDEIRHIDWKIYGRTDRYYIKQFEEETNLAGTVVLVGVPTPDMRIDLPMIDIFGRGGSLKSSWYGDCLPSRDFPLLIDLYLQGRLPLERFVSEEIGLDEVEAAFTKLPHGGGLRAVVRRAGHDGGIGHALALSKGYDGNG